MTSPVTWKVPPLPVTISNAFGCTLRELPKIGLSSAARMMDFALWGAACEKALGWRKASFLDAYQENRASGMELH